MSVLTFDALTHTYRYEGQVVPSVTQVLQPFYDFSMIPREVLERKRLIGEWTHAGIELDLQDNLDEDSIDDSWLGYFQGWRKFRNESGFVVQEAEQRVFSTKYRVAGTLDLLGTLPKIGQALIDTKTVAVTSPATGLQTAAYAELRGVQKAKRYGLQLRPNGTYELHPFADRADFPTFLAALTIFNWKKRNG